MDSEPRDEATMEASLRPRVSIGLPVYNGERFLEESIDSLLAQTFKDFELIISDNASTDSTEAICRSYAARDKRIRYFRNSENLGAARNFNLVFELAKGEYFKWASHDDLCHPDFLARSVEVFDRDPEVVLCYSRTTHIDEEGRPIMTWESRSKLASPAPVDRFREVIYGGGNYGPSFGLIRADVLRRTPLIGPYAFSDAPLLAELNLYGRSHEIEEILFFTREHEERSVRVYEINRPHRFAEWFDPENAAKIIFPRWRLFTGYLSAINRAPLPWRERACLYGEMVGWLTRPQRMKGLLFDLFIAGGRFLRLRLSAR